MRVLSRGRGRAAGPLLALVVVATSCAGVDDAGASRPSTEQPATTDLGVRPTSTVTRPAVTLAGERPELPLGFTRCEDLLSTGVVTGALSDDGRVGFDEAGLTAYLAPYVDTMGGAWTDLVTRRWTVSFATDVETRRREIEAEFPGVQVVEANMTEAELRALQSEMLAELIERGLGSGASGYVQAGGGVVGLDVAVLDERTVTAVAEFADPSTACLTGQEVDRYTPPGPQAPEGDGWRLLGLEPVDLPFQAAFDQPGLDDLWARYAPGQPVPPVDFTTEIVVAIPTGGRGTETGPCGTRFDGWWVDGGVLRLDVPVPGGAAMCNLASAPGSYLIAIDDTELPAGDIPAEVVRKQSDEPVLVATFIR